MTSEQFSAVELLARLEDKSIEEYIHQKVNDAIPSHIDTIANEGDRAALQKDWDEGTTTTTSFDTSRKIIVNCELHANPKKLQVISKIAEANEEDPSQLLEETFHSTLKNELDLWQDIPAVEKLKFTLANNGNSDD